MTKLIVIEGIGPAYEAALNAAGIKSIEHLLKTGASPAGRKELAERSGLSPKLVLEWVNRADLMRIKGVGEEYSDLLERAGVDTVVELAQRNAENLLKRMTEINADGTIVRRLPTLNQVTAWVAQARELPRILSY